MHIDKISTITSIERVAYKVEPLAQLKVYPIFNMSVVKPYFPYVKDQSHNMSKQLNININFNMNQVVEDILSEGIIEGPTIGENHTKYLVK